ncbi:MAG: AsmA family protein, partial [Alphaproteobacteria bacterium]|nr:AsmA family protein [Alphaproteobacteria bacterium]
MLNRLYIAVGVLAILVLGAGFVVPRFFDWGQYRTQIEAVVGEALGAQVSVRGEISFTLLPQPKLRLTDVAVGDPADPDAQINEIEADFALMEFFRDRYEVTGLEIVSPRVVLDIGGDGRFAMPFHMPQSVSTTNVSVREATITGGSVLVRDGRTGERWEVIDFAGTVNVGSPGGPYSLEGTGSFKDTAYSGRVTVLPRNEFGELGTSMFLRPVDGRFSISADGVTKQGEIGPRFEGKMEWRQTPGGAPQGQFGTGDAVLDGNLTLTASRALLSNFTFVPDENQPATRFGGGADLTLGADRGFNAVVSAGVVALAPRDVRTETGQQAYELLRLFEDLPELPMAPLPGTLSVEISELDLHGLKLSRVLFDATSFDGGWQVGEFSARLPGNTTVSFSGTATNIEGAPALRGELNITSTRLDALASQWREPDGGNILFGARGELTAQARVQAGMLSLGRAVLDVGDTEVSFELQAASGNAAILSVEADLGSLDERQSALLLALVPDPVRDRAFSASFPRGAVLARAEQISIFGQTLGNTSLKGEWSEAGFFVENLVIGDVAGAKVIASGTARGTLGAPDLLGNVTVDLGEAAQPDQLLEFFGLNETPAWIAKIAAINLPLRIDARFGALDGLVREIEILAKGGDLAAEGRVELSEGLARARRAPLIWDLTVDGPGPGALAAGLGLVPLAISNSSETEDNDARLSWHAEGTLANSVETSIVYQSGAEKISFAGALIAVGPGAMVGNGLMEVELNAGSVVGQVLRLGDVPVPQMEGRVRVKFGQDGEIEFSELVARAGPTAISGSAKMDISKPVWDVTGTFDLDLFDIGGFGAYLGGAGFDNREHAGLSASPWPGVPFKAGNGGPRSTGRLDISAGSVRAGDGPLVTNATFGLDWEGGAARVRGFTGTMGSGAVSADIRVCCGGDPLRQMSGRIAVAGVELGEVLSARLSERFSGTADLSARFTGSGTSLADIAGNLVGEGSYALRDVGINGF